MAKSIVPIILGLVAIVLLAIALFLMAFVGFYFFVSGISLLLITVGLILMMKQRLYKGGVIVLFAGIVSLVVTLAVIFFIARDIFLFLISGISLLLTVGLILMMKQRLLYKGGVIVLFAGIASLVMFFLVEGIALLLLFFEGRFYPLLLMLSSILAIISGSLGIKKSEEHKGDYRGVIVPITGLLFAIFPAFVFIYHHVRHIPVLYAFPAGPMFVAFALIPLLIIAIVLNIIGMFKVRKETNPKAKIIAKVLTGLTWSMIAIFVVLLFTWGGPVL